MATVDVLFEGYAHDRVAGTVSCIRDGETIAVVDPGMVPSRSSILDPLLGLGVDPAAVTDVILSHHHPDHTINIALFENARVHDHWAIYDKDEWIDRPADGEHLTDDIWFMTTPGHTAEDMTTLARTADGVVALTHLWWDSMSEGDPLAEDEATLLDNRGRVLEVATVIVPGHGAAFGVR
jgi:glyoxylase-like metal-dependent hydrolase (beta-lactamase superfamily II)